MKNIKIHFIKSSFFFLLFINFRSCFKPELSDLSAYQHLKELCAGFNSRYFGLMPYETFMLLNANPCLLYDILVNSLKVLKNK